MKALSLSQPWATLVAIGAKKIETRSWQTSYRSWQTSYRGPLAIHASKGFPAEYRDLCFEAPFREAMATAGIHYVTDLPRGAVIATCELVAVGRVEEFGVDQSEQEHAFGDYSPGRYGWLFYNVRQLPQSIPAKGALSLWEWEPPEGLL